MLDLSSSSPRVPGPRGWRVSSPVSHVQPKHTATHRCTDTHTLAADHIRGGPFLPESTGLWINILFWIKCFPYLLFFPSRLQVELVWNQKSYVHSFEWKSGPRGTLRNGNENSLSERELVTTFVQILRLPQILRYTSNKGCAVLSRSGRFPSADHTAPLPRILYETRKCVCVCSAEVHRWLWIRSNWFKRLWSSQGCCSVRVFYSPDASVWIEIEGDSWAATARPEPRTSEAEGDDGGVLLNYAIMSKLLPEPLALSDPGL